MREENLIIIIILVCTVSILYYYHALYGISSPPFNIETTYGMVNGTTWALTTIEGIVRIGH